MPKDRFTELADYYDSKKDNYTTYGIKQKIENLISRPQISADELLAGVNLLPDINDIKEIKKTAQLLYKEGLLDKKNLALVTNKTNFIRANLVHNVLNHLANTGLLERHLEWVLHSGNNLGPFSLKLDILTKNGLLTEKNLQALQAGKAEQLPRCIFIMQDANYEDSHLTPMTKDHISACGDIASELSINPFKLNPTWVSDPLPVAAKNDPAINKPTDNSMCPSSNVSALMDSNAMFSSAMLLAVGFPMITQISATGLILQFLCLQLS